MKKFIAALLFLLMLACAALAKAGHPGELRPRPETTFPEKTTREPARQQHHQIRTPAHRLVFFI